MSAKAPTPRIGRPPLYRSPTVKRSLRIPKPLDRRAQAAARREGVSLSQWIAAAMAVSLEKPTTAEIATQIALLAAGRGRNS